MYMVRKDKEGGRKGGAEGEEEREQQAKEEGTRHSTCLVSIKYANIAMEVPYVVKYVTGSMTSQE